MTSPPLTIFSSTRAFEGEFERIQINALTSWISLDPRPEVIVLGDEAGTEKACSALGIRWVRQIEVTGTGAPMLDSVFREVQRIANGQLLAYINPDVIVLQEFVDAIEEIHSRLRRFVLIAAPWNARVESSLIGPSQDWAATLRALKATAAPPRLGADVFLFPKGAFDPIPPVAIGRLGWDNWLLWRAATIGIPSVDISESVTFIHQDHGGSTHRGSLTRTLEVFEKEVARNLTALHWWEEMIRRTDMPYVLGLDLRLKKRRHLGLAGLIVRATGRKARLTVKPVLAKTRLTRPLLKFYGDK